MNSIIENSIGGIISALVCTGMGFGIQRWISNRVKIRRITRADDPDIEEALELYSSHFPPDGSNYTADEILRNFSDEEGNSRKFHVPEENFFLIAKHRGDVIGFIWCCYYPERQHGIIPYLATDKRYKKARLGVAEQLVKHLNRLLRRHSSPGRRLVFETKKPIENVDADERSERSARIRLFKSLGNHLKTPVLEPDFSYTRPRLSLEDGEHASEEELVLMFADLTAPKGSTKIPHRVEKEAVMQILEFIHLDCYGDYYEPDEPRHSEYQAYLRNRIEQFRATMPEWLPVKKRKSGK